jgi:hypothetical protein
VLVLAAPMGVTLLVAGVGGLVQLAAGAHVDPFLRDVLVFGYGTLGPPAVGLAALAASTQRAEGEGGLLHGALTALLMVPGYWAVVLAVCAAFALDFPHVGALGLLVSYAAFCSFAGWLRLRPRPRAHQAIVAVLLLGVGAVGAIPEASEPLRPVVPPAPLGRTGPPPPPAEPPVAEEVPPEPVPDDPLPPVGSMPMPPADELVRPAPDSDLTRPAPRRGVRLEGRIQRQLARNGLSRVTIRVEPDAIVATGLVASEEEQLRLRLVVESLAPYLPLVDLTRIARRR